MPVLDCIEQKLNDTPIVTAYKVLVKDSVG